MDIAKIRKKRKESEADEQHQKVIGQTTTAPEDHANPDEKISGSEILPEPFPAKQVTDQPQEPGKSREETKQTGKKERGTEEVKVSPPERAEEREGEKTEKIIEILTFTLLKQEFAFRISQLEEILRYQWITRVPQTPHYVIGVTSLRGKVIPIIDLKLKLTLTERAADKNKKGKILIVKGPKGPIGVTVDTVIGVVRIAESEILPPPSHLSEAELKFIEGIAVVEKRFVSIINMEEAVALHLK